MLRWLFILCFFPILAHRAAGDAAVMAAGGPARAAVVAAVEAARSGNWSAAEVAQEAIVAALQRARSGQWGKAVHHHKDATPDEIAYMEVSGWG